MKRMLLASSLVTLLSFYAFAGEKIVIEPQIKSDGKPTPWVKKSEQVTVSGPLQIVAMQGANVAVQSTNYGMVILFMRNEVEPALGARLTQLEASHAGVRVSGKLNTVCSESQLKSDVMGCRRFDTTKPITIELM